MQGVKDTAALSFCQLKDETDGEKDEGGRPETPHAAELEHQPLPELRPSSSPSRNSSSLSTSRCSSGKPPGDPACRRRARAAAAARASVVVVPIAEQQLVVHLAP
ncbi:unnamed protein product [Urochloa humidicola]